MRGQSVIILSLASNLKPNGGRWVRIGLQRASGTVLVRDIFIGNLKFILKSEYFFTMVGASYKLAPDKAYK